MIWIWFGSSVLVFVFIGLYRLVYCSEKDGLKLIFSCLLGFSVTFFIITSIVFFCTLNTKIEVSSTETVYSNVSDYCKINGANGELKGISFTTSDGEEKNFVFEDTDDVNFKNNGKEVSKITVMTKDQRYIIDFITKTETIYIIEGE